MHIVVCVKAVPGSTEVKMDPVTNTIVRDGGDAVVNPFDLSALELALVIKDIDAAQGKTDRVTVLSMGIPATETLLRDCIARGATDAYLLSDRAFAGADTLATTYALTCGIEHIGMPDLVLCGKMAVDGDTAQIGPELSEALGASCVTDVRELLAWDTRQVTVRHALDDGIDTVKASLPAVLTVAKEAATLRMPSIAGICAAEHALVTIWSAADVDADAARTGLTGSPTQVVRSFVPERKRSGVEITGMPHEQAIQLIKIIDGVI